MSNKTSLWSLQLSGNQFVGTLSNWISHYPSLQLLDISDNFISGEIPSFIGNLSLEHLNMAGNEIEGTIPCESELSFLDFSHNNLSSTLPSCLKCLSYLEHLNLEGNRFTGSNPKNLFNSSSYMIMKTLNIGNKFLSGEVPTSIGNLSNLRVLHLGGNNLSGLIPEEFCRLNELGILDLSHNSFSGPIPSCFIHISFGKESTFDFTQVSVGHRGTIKLSYSLHGKLSNKLFMTEDSFFVQQVQVKLVTKAISDIYKGKLLEMMSELDLSYNQLTGEIPAELGNLSSILTLNLFYNQSTSSIPRTLKNFKQVESLDLSYNKLSEKISSELVSLYFLEIFNVAYYNLLGRLPDMKGQFGIFDSKSCEGNPFLCGPPLVRSCNIDLPKLSPSSNASNGKWHDIVDPVSFLASFMATYLVVMLAFVAILNVNP